MARAINYSVVKKLSCLAGYLGFLMVALPGIMSCMTVLFYLALD